MITIESLLCSHNIGVKLKSLKVKQDSQYHYILARDTHRISDDIRDRKGRICAAYGITEVGDILPSHLFDKRYTLTIEKFGEVWRAGYYGQANNLYVNMSDKMIDALSLVLVDVTKDGLLAKEFLI